MSKRDLSLATRNEHTRNEKEVVLPIQFSRIQIKKHFDDNLDEIKKQFNLANVLIEKDDIVGCEMIWRSQMVFSEALLDFYLHEISKYCMFKMFCNNWEKTERYKNFMIPMFSVDKALSMNDSKGWFFELLTKRFSREVFLSAESMKDQLNLIGLGFTKVMTKDFPERKEGDSVKNGRKTIEDLFKRRNEIVHQNDRSHIDAEQNSISEEQVKCYINKIECIVNAIDECVKENDAKK